MRWSPAAVVLLVAAPAFGHGGRYVGPLDEIPPDVRIATDWPPPDISGGPVPPTDGHPGTPTAPGGGGVAARSRELTYESWRFAWHLRENGVVEARFRERGGMPPLSGDGLSAGTIENEILPALRGAAADARLPTDICLEALLGLVRVGDDGSIDFLRGAARNKGREQYHMRVEQAGVLALGWIDGDRPGNAAILRAIIQDPQAKTRSRCFACVALARLERRNPSLDTLRLFESALFCEGDEGPFSREMAVTAAYALGRLASPEASAILRRFLGAPLPEAKNRGSWYEETYLAQLPCHAAASLGRAAGASGDAGECEDALRAFETVVRKGEPLAVQGAVLGLGFLGAGAPPDVATKCVRRLDALLEPESTEGQARRFASLSLARIVAHGPGGARDIALEALVRALKASRPTPSWAALAAGLAGEGRTSAERADLARAVRKAWQSPAAPGVRVVEDRGGCLVALGLLGDVGARPLLGEILGDEGQDSDLRGYAATALGLLGDPTAVPVLRKALQEPKQRGWKRPVVVALGLLGDSESVPAILDVMRNPKSNRFLLGGAAQALGYLRDGTATDPLLGIAADGKHPDLTRAMAWQALARMAAGRRPDPFAELTEDVPYRACCDSLETLWSIL